MVQNLITGKVSEDCSRAQEFLNRPHVAVAFEALLSKYNISDDKLVERLSTIINRKVTVSEGKNGVVNTNVASIDANAKDTIRLIWQVQGRFVDKHEVRGEMHNYNDSDLDNIISSGMNFLRNRGKVQLNGNIDPSCGGPAPTDPATN
jgi:hypothetical protein